MTIFKVTAEGDTVYLEADNLKDAMKQFKQKIGDVPASLLTFEESFLPEDEELL